MNEEIILDASAVLALLNEEPGHEQVAKLLEGALISTVNFSEVITVLSDANIPLNEAEEMTSAIISEIIPFDQKQAMLAASLRKTTRPYGLSFGDRACIALAKTRKSLVLTADKIWGKLHIEGVKIQVIR